MFKNFSRLTRFPITRVLGPLIPITYGIKSKNVWCNPIPSQNPLSTTYFVTHSTSSHLETELEKIRALLFDDDYIYVRVKLIKYEKTCSVHDTMEEKSDESRILEEFDCLTKDNIDIVYKCICRGISNYVTDSEKTCDENMEHMIIKSLQTKIEKYNQEFSSCDYVIICVSTHIHKNSGDYMSSHIVIPLNGKQVEYMDTELSSTPIFSNNDNCRSGCDHLTRNYNGGV